MTHGGKREGAGRKKLSNKYKEKTCPVRIPLSLLSTVQVLLQKKQQQHGLHESNTPFIPHPNALNIERPFFLNAVSAGIPLAADDHIDCMLDLNTHLISNPSTTFFVRVAGDSMTGANIFDGDLLVVDRGLKPRIQDIVIAIVNSDLTVKRFIPSDNGVILKAENSEYADIQISSDTDFTIWGVVMHIIHKSR
jgi:DNA polymerase V